MYATVFQFPGFKCQRFRTANCGGREREANSSYFSSPSVFFKGSIKRGKDDVEEIKKKIPGIDGRNRSAATRAILFISFLPGELRC